MKLISYWKNSTPFYNDNGLVLITGWYDHKNENNGGHKALGIHWETYPQSRNTLSPCVIPETTRNAVLAGLLHSAVTNGNNTQIENIKKAIEFFTN